MLHALDDRLTTVQLEYQEEQGNFSDVEILEAEIEKAQLDLAIQLVEQVAIVEFHPGNYVDEIRHNMMEMIGKKTNGQDIVVFATRAGRSENN